MAKPKIIEELGNKVNAIAVGSTADPDTTEESYILTNHANSPGEGIYWHILTMFYSRRDSNRSQVAVAYNGSTPRIKLRHYFQGTWYPWTEAVTDSPIQWRNLALQNNWKESLFTPQYAKKGNQVIFRGRITGGSLGGTEYLPAFTLPEGYRIARTASFLVSGYDTNSWARAYAFEDGRVSIQNTMSGQTTAPLELSGLIIPIG